MHDGRNQQHRPALAISTFNYRHQTTYPILDESVSTYWDVRQFSQSVPIPVHLISNPSLEFPTEKPDPTLQMKGIIKTTK